LFRTAYALCGSVHDAEDLVQETYARALRGPRFARRGANATELLRLLRGIWAGGFQAREERAHDIHLEEVAPFVEDPNADPSVTMFEVRAVYAAIRELPPSLRETIAAVDVLGLSYEQAATALDVPVGTVMSRLHRARAKVAGLLQ
jgi:RNA polymerase sigma-70 factor (ECF subfamily)